MRKLFFIVGLVTLFFMPSVANCQVGFHFKNSTPFGQVNPSPDNILRARLISISISTWQEGAHDNGIILQEAYGRALKRAGLKEDQVKIVEFIFVVRPDSPTEGVFWFIVEKK